MVFRRICLADGSVPFVRTGCLSMVLALVAAVPAVCFDVADHHLGGEHHPYLLRLASANTWTAVVGSTMGHAAGIRVHGNGRCNFRFTPSAAFRFSSAWGQRAS